MAARRWRRRKGHDTWHFCSNCSLWPTSDYDERTDKPTTGELCDQCRSKDSAGTCNY
jgi:hypothetical protein